MKTVSEDDVKGIKHSVLDRLKYLSILAFKEFYDYHYSSGLNMTELPVKFE